MTERTLCIHAHFYQPPRENPWLESIELQDSAHPYHDWNERITAECYAPNMASRILNGEGDIIEIVNNYSKISFNFGPTLLSWLEEKTPDVYEAILEADRVSQKNFSGHGSALAQAFNHSILPLCNARDKETQIRWGLADFKLRFGRDPEGLWLPETAANTETLEVLAAHGIRFTILSPFQGARSRMIGASQWDEHPDGSIDPTMPYRVNLPSGRQISLFFYDGPIARAVSFEKLLSNGDDFANRLMSAFSAPRNWVPLVHIATDGETYGHHHRHGEMALSYALHHIESEKLVKLTNYGETLEKYPPTHEVEIHENTSWSCFHGVERWKSDCGCNTGASPDWNQAWRRPLRDALDWLRDTVTPQFEQTGRTYFKDPWEARNAYIAVIIRRIPETIDEFFREHAIRPLNGEERVRALKLIEMERQTLLMYTSCGWFFNDLTNIETIQILAYAGRALQLAQEVFGSNHETEFLNRLSEAQSNIPEMGNGRDVFERSVRPSIVTLEKVGAHYAMTSLFQTYEEQSLVYCYSIDRDDYTLISSGKAKLALGRALISSHVTEESRRVIFAAVNLGDHNITAATREFQNDEQYQNFITIMTQSFESGDLPGFFRMIDKNFGSSVYSLKELFKDEQRTIINLVLDTSLREAETSYTQLYEQYSALMRFLNELTMPLPKEFSMAAEFSLNHFLKEALDQEEPDLGRISFLLEEAKRMRIPIDEEEISYTLEKTIDRVAGQFFAAPDQLALLALLDLMVDLASTPPLKTNFWKTQNIFHNALHALLPGFKERASKGDEMARQWVEHFNLLGEKLKVKN